MIAHQYHTAALNNKKIRRLHFNAQKRSINQGKRGEIRTTSAMASCMREKNSNKLWLSVRITPTVPLAVPNTSESKTEADISVDQQKKKKT
jgi:hypothetical protein